MVNAGFPLTFATMILSFRDSTLTRALYALLLIIRPAPPDDALLAFLQAEDVMPVLFSTCWYNILSSCTILWSTIPSIGVAYVLRLFTNSLRLLSNRKVLTFIIATFAYCLQLSNLSFALLLSCTSFPFGFGRAHSLACEPPDFAVQRGQK